MAKFKEALANMKKKFGKKPEVEKLGPSTAVVKVGTETGTVSYAVEVDKDGNVITCSAFVDTGYLAKTKEEQAKRIADVKAKLAGKGMTVTDETKFEM